MSLSSIAPYALIALINVPLAAFYGADLYAIATGSMMVTWFVLGV